MGNIVCIAIRDCFTGISINKQISGCVLFVRSVLYLLLD